MRLLRRASLLAAGFAVLLVFASSDASAQVSLASNKSEAEEADKVEARVWTLLEEAISKTPSLKLAENRIQFQTTAACLLWPRDENRARALLKESMNAFAAFIGGADKGDPEFVNRMQVLTVMRFELVRMIASRDAKLALDFLRATRQEQLAGRHFLAGKPLDNELALELILAGGIVAKDARQAARIAEESLQKGIGAGLLNVLNRLNEKDRGAATDLAADIIRKLQTEDLANNNDAIIVATNLVGMTRAAGIAARSNSDGAVAEGAQTAPSRLIEIDEQSRRELVQVIVSAVVKTPASGMNTAHLLFNSLPKIMPEVERYAPAQLAVVRQKREEFRQSLDPYTRMWQKYADVRQRGTVDALLEAAVKAPPEIGDELYEEAAFKVLEGDDPERARQIINSISDPQKRAARNKNLDRQMLARTMLRGKLEDARQQLAGDAPVEERISNLLYLSNLAVQKNETASARRFLDEASALTGGRAQNRFQFSAQLQIARAFAEVEPKQSFAIIEGVIDQLNELLAAAVVVDGFGPECFREGELKPFVGNMWGELVVQCGEELAALASKDAGRALTAAQRFERDEARLYVVLQVAKRVLSDIEAKKSTRLAAQVR